MLFTERQSSAVTSTGPLLECLESCDNEEPRHPVDSLPLSFLPNQRFVDVRNDATTNCSLEERVQFFISTNSKLQVTRGKALHLQVFRCISKDLCRRDSRTAARCTAAVAPTRPRLAVLDFRCRWRQPPGNTLNSAAAQTSKAEKGPDTEREPPPAPSSPCDSNCPYFPFFSCRILNRHVLKNRSTVSKRNNFYCFDS